MDVPWHHDGERCRTVWLPLDDVDERSGGLLVLPGRHKSGRTTFRKLRSKADVTAFSFFSRYSLYEVDVGGAKRQPWAVQPPQRKRRLAGAAGGARRTASTSRRTAPAAARDASSESPTAYQMPAGGLALHHPQLPHCSGPNQSDKQRRVIIMRFQCRAESLEPEGLVKELCTGVGFPKQSFAL